MKKLRSLVVAFALAAAIFVVAVAVAACGGSSSTTGSTSPTTGSQTTGSQTSANATAKFVKIDGQQIPVSGPLRLAVFLPGVNNSYLQALIAELHRQIKTIPGAQMTIFDGGFNATTQLNQIQTAIQDKKYNTFIASPVDGQLTCKALTQQAPQAGIVVAVGVLAPCGRTADNGAAQRAPGTLTFVGGTESSDYWYDYLSWIAKQNPGPQKVLTLTDPAAPFPLTANFDTALKQVQKTYPDFQVVGSDATDLTVPTSETDATSLIQANPDATLLITMYSTETQGAVNAIKLAGKTGQIKVYDKGTGVGIVPLVKNGAVAATSPEFPVPLGDALLKAIVSARAGKPYLPYYRNDGAPVPAGAPATGFTVFTKKTIDKAAQEGS